jgi:4-coumarate--CoA ligase
MVQDGWYCNARFGRFLVSVATRIIGLWSEPWSGFASSSAIVDRKKELIKYKGWQGLLRSYLLTAGASWCIASGTVPPAELEALLLERPDISDSGVIGVFSDAEATELPRAYIVPRDVAILEDAKRSAAFANDVDTWVKSKVAQHKFLRGGASLVLL